MPKAKSGHKRSFSVEQRREAVAKVDRLVKDGATTEEAIAKVGLVGSQYYMWRKSGIEAGDLSRGGIPRFTTEAEEAEAKLQLENRLLRNMCADLLLEREMHRRS